MSVPLLIEQFAGQLSLLYSDGRRQLAYKQGSGSWLLEGAADPDPGPDPDPEGFAWPFDPNTIGTEWEGYPGHKGIDFEIPPGVPIPASNAGTILYSGWYEWGWGWGNMVTIDHGNIGVGGVQLLTLYAHMLETPPVTVGQTVTKGQTIGLIGSTGDSTGPHLHWETHEGGWLVQVPPRDFMAEYGE